MAMVICTKGKLVIEVDWLFLAAQETGIPIPYIRHLIETGNEKNGWTFDYVIDKMSKKGIALDNRTIQSKIKSVHK